MRILFTIFIFVIASSKTQGQDLSISVDSAYRSPYDGCRLFITISVTNNSKQNIYIAKKQFIDQKLLGFCQPVDSSSHDAILITNLDIPLDSFFELDISYSVPAILFSDSAYLLKKMDNDFLANNRVNKTILHNHSRCFIISPSKKMKIHFLAFTSKTKMAYFYRMNTTQLEKFQAALCLNIDYYSTLKNKEKTILASSSESQSLKQALMPRILSTQN